MVKPLILYATAFRFPPRSVGGPRRSLASSDLAHGRRPAAQLEAGLRARPRAGSACVAAQHDCGVDRRFMFADIIAIYNPRQEHARATARLMIKSDDYHEDDTIQCASRGTPPSINDMNLHDYCRICYLVRFSLTQTSNLGTHSGDALARPLLHRTTRHALPRCCSSCIIISAPWENPAFVDFSTACK